MALGAVAHPVRPDHRFQRRGELVRSGDAQLGLRPGDEAIDPVARDLEEQLGLAAVGIVTG